MFVPIKPETKPVVEAAQKGGIFLVTVGIAGNGFWVTKVESVNVGFVPGKGPGASGQGGGGWCRITAPDQGCVAAQFLVFGGGGGGGLKPAAGFAREKPKGKGGAGFTGRWKAVADGVSYSMSLTQTPKGAVTGQFSGSDGSAGNINGSVSGNTLRFRWVQSSDSQRGAGKFVLAADGRSFTGSYSFSDNPDAVEGSWNGTRQ
jgi:hypothetical protein